MELDQIREVKDIFGTGVANELLRKGWILLDAKVVQVGNAESGMKGGVHYILGKRPTPASAKDFPCPH